MTLIRWEPVRELDRLFDSLFATQTVDFGRRWTPPTDLVEHEDAFVLRMDLPGLSEEDVSIEVDRGVLTLSGERRFEHEEARSGLRRIERASGAFKRAMTLPDGADPDLVEARFDRGVLEVRVPKPEKPEPRKIAITPGERRELEEATA